jgi:hypothetical protein
VALVFVGLLAVGFALAVAVYESFVAYRPVAGQHVGHGGKGAQFVARFDLTHVMLYEPFRRYIFPLVDLGGEGRRERLGEQGFQVGGEVREVAVAFGSDASEWSVVLGGPLADDDVSATLAKVLRAENRRVDERSGVFTVGGGRLVFAQADDGALLLASSEARLRSALPASPEPEPLGQGAGGLRVSRSWLPNALTKLQGSYRAGSVLLVDLSAETTGGTTDEEAKAALKALLQRIGGLDPVLKASAENAVIRAIPGRVTAEVSLSNTAVERLAARAVDALGLSPVEVGQR